MIYTNKLHNKKSRRPQEHGSILIVVMWIAFGLVSVTLLFGHSMMLEYRATDNYVAGMEAQQAVEGAFRYSIFILSNLEEAGTMPDITTYESENVPIGMATFWILGRGGSNNYYKKHTFGFIDEASKLNLNTATQEMLEALPGMTAELAASIIDWRDTDDDVTANGAESETYLTLNPPYNCKNAPFETIEELRLVWGADWNILYGEDTNMNGYLDPNEDDGNESPPEDNRNGVLEPGILEYVTVYSREPNQSEDPGGSAGGDTGSTESEYRQGLVNVNTASAAVLACIPGIGTENAEQLVDYRQDKTTDELSSTDWVSQLLGESSFSQASQYITTKSYQYTADIAAVGHGGKGLARTQFVFDTVSGTPVVVFRRDRTRLGWPLGTILNDQWGSVKRK